MEAKFCRDCGELRPISEFTSNRNSKDGYAFYCRDHARRRHQVSRDKRLGVPNRRRPPVGIRIPTGSTWSPVCDQVLPIEMFGRNAGASSGTGTCCKPCHNARGRRSRELVGGGRTYHLRRRYGITAADADAMLEAQGGLCAICRAARALHVDHDHISGTVRALLCFNCNGGLGQFKDDPAVLRAAADYVEEHRRRQAGSGPGRSPRGDGRPSAGPSGRR